MARDYETFWDVTAVRDHVKRAAAVVGQWAAHEFEGDFADLMTWSGRAEPSHWGLPLESPLEAIFYVWWKATVGDNPRSHYNRLFKLGNYILDSRAW